MKRYIQIAVVASLVGLIGCQQTAPKLSEADIAAVKANYIDWGAAISEKHYEALPGLLAADYWAFRDDQPDITSREAYVAWAKTWGPDMRQSWVVDEVNGYADLAFSRATVSESIARPDGTRESSQAVCFCTHRRQPDGTWQFSRAICRDRKPQPAQATHVFDNWVKMLEAGDVKGVMNLFAEDVIWSSPEKDDALVNGNEALKRRIARTFAWAKASNAVLTVDREEVVANWAYVTASFSASWTEPNGKQTEERSQYVCVLNRAAGGPWKIWRFTFFPAA